MTAGEVPQDTLVTLPMEMMGVIPFVPAVPLGPWQPEVRLKLNTGLVVLPVITTAGDVPQDTLFTLPIEMMGVTPFVPAVPLGP